MSVATSASQIEVRVDGERVAKREESFGNAQLF